MFPPVFGARAKSCHVSTEMSQTGEIDIKMSLVLSCDELNKIHWVSAFARLIPLVQDIARRNMYQASKCFLVSCGSTATLVQILHSPTQDFEIWAYNQI